MKRNYFLIILLFFIGAALFVSGCTVTGGGTLDSANQDADGAKANFGFVLNYCNPDEPKGVFNYHDMAYMGTYNDIDYTGVKMQGKLITLDEMDIGEAVATLSYRSTNPQVRGEGEAVIIVEDGIFEDHFSIEVNGGPFDGYTNDGFIQGSIEQNECDYED